ncbi:thiolase family protein [Candidatus Alkanophaga liquidiphilum]
MNKVAIIGCGALSIGKYPKSPENELALEVIRLALEDASVSKDEIEGLYATPNYITTLGLHLSVLAEYIRISPKSMAEIGCGGVAAGLTLKYAANEIMLRNVKVAVCFGAVREHSLGIFKRQDFLDMFEPLTRVYARGGVIWAYACSARRYMHEFGATEEHFALAAVRDRNAATKNPLAYFREKITVDDVLKSPMLSSPIKLLDASAARDGAAAVVLCAAEDARKYTDTPIYIKGIGEHHDNSAFVPTDRCKSITSFEANILAARRAFEAAKLEPKDVDVAEVYAPFSPQELMVPEDLGFFEKGEMVKAIEEGETEVGGRIPINTDGGLLSRGHPAMATPFYETISIIKQLRGEAPNQIAGAEIGLMHCEGGMLNNAMVFILERED